MTVDVIELHVGFWLLGLLLLILEVVLGMTLGVALAGSITCFALGLVVWMNLISGMNGLLVFGTLVFVISTFGILRHFKNRVNKAPEVKDVNDY